MINFRNDYCYIAHPLILEKMSKISSEVNDGYGIDNHSKHAKELILNLIDNKDSDVHFLVGGTITNKVLISHVLKPYEAVICCDSGHINVHETGTIEQSGHKVLTVENIDGKLTCDGIKKVLLQHNGEHMVKPKMVYISNSTEFGTIYHLEEIKSIYQLCQENNLYFFIDGARLGVALTSIDNDITLKDLARYCDAFYIGGTKNGALLGEALVVNNVKLNKEIRYSIKHYGGMYAKGFVTGIQFEVLMENDLFFEIARQQNQLAAYLVNKLEEIDVEIFIRNSTNQVFALFSKDEAEKILQVINCEQFGIKDDKIIIRFVVSYVNKIEDVDQAIKEIKKIKGR